MEYSDGGVLIDDLKTGRWPVDPDDNAQIKSYALFHWAWRGRPHDWYARTRITQWPKYPIDQPPRLKWGRRILSTLDVEEHAADLLWAEQHPTELNPDGSGEGHCKFCDAQPDCPAWQT